MQTVLFLGLIFLLKKFAWKPILDAVNEREDGIKNALLSAENARKEMENLQADNQRILNEARAERDAMLKEAREMKEKMIADAGLKGEYSKLEPTETDLRHCGGCGGELQTVKGGKAMVCEDCGTVVDIGNPEVNCKNCAGMISFPVGKNRIQCPYCQAEAQRMSW